MTKGKRGAFYDDDDLDDGYDDDYDDDYYEEEPAPAPKKASRLTLPRRQHAACGRQHAACGMPATTQRAGRVRLADTELLGGCREGWRACPLLAAGSASPPARAPQPPRLPTSSHMFPQAELAKPQAGGKQPAQTAPKAAPSAAPARAAGASKLAQSLCDPPPPGPGGKAQRGGTQGCEGWTGTGLGDAVGCHGSGLRDGQALAPSMAS